MECEGFANDLRSSARIAGAGAGLAARSLLEDARRQVGELHGKVEHRLRPARELARIQPTFSALHCVTRAIEELRATDDLHEGLDVAEPLGKAARSIERGAYAIVGSYQAHAQLPRTAIRLALDGHQERIAHSMIPLLDQLLPKVVVDLPKPSGPGSPTEPPNTTSEIGVGLPAQFRVRKSPIHAAPRDTRRSTDQKAEDWRVISDVTPTLFGVAGAIFAAGAGPEREGGQGGGGPWCPHHRVVLLT